MTWCQTACAHNTVSSADFDLLKEDGGFMRSITDLNIVMDGNEFTDFSAFVSG